MSRLPTELPTERVLPRLELLRHIKGRMHAGGYPSPSPFHAGTISRWDRWPIPGTVDAIHCEAFAEILARIEMARDEKEPQVLALTGEAGMGKSHLLTRLMDPSVTERERIVPVRCLGTIRADEVETVLLDRLLTALTSPSPMEEHLLLGRIREVGFRSLELLVGSGNAEVQKALKRGGAISSWFYKSKRVGQLNEKLRARDSTVFEQLDPDAFTDFAAKRFLPEPSNPCHRAILGQLFEYLNPKNRDDVLGWFRGESDMLPQMYPKVENRTAYHRQELIKVLVSLFTPEITEGLRYGSASGEPATSRVFVFIFDQMEEQQHLFKGDAEWLTYFALLSNLYHHLRNVVLLFPLSPTTFDRLHATMESGLQDRIPRNRKLQLQRVLGDDALTLYRQRLGDWLGEDAGRLQGDCLPFDEETVKSEAVAAPTLRALLNRLDARFRNYIENDVRMDDPSIDFLTHLREEKIRLAAAWNTTPESLEASDLRVMDFHHITIENLLARHGRTLLRQWGLEMVENIPFETGKLQGLRWTFAVPGSNRRVVLHLFFLRKNLTEPCGQALSLLKNTRADSTFVHLVRHAGFDLGTEKRNQLFGHTLSVDSALRLTSLLLLLDRCPEAPLTDLIRDELKATYLGAVFDQAALAVQGKLNVGTDEEASS